MGKRNLPAALFDSSQGAASRTQQPSSELLLGDVLAVPQPPWASTVSACTQHGDECKSDWQVQNT